MNKHQSTSHQVNKSTESMQLVVLPSSLVEKPSAWIQNGTSPTEVTLAIAVVIVAVSSVIASFACLAQVLVANSKPKSISCDKNSPRNEIFINWIHK